MGEIVGRAPALVRWSPDLFGRLLDHLFGCPLNLGYLLDRLLGCRPDLFGRLFDENLFGRLLNLFGYLLDRLLALLTRLYRRRLILLRAHERLDGFGPRKLLYGMALTRLLLAELSVPKPEFLAGFGRWEKGLLRGAW